MSTHTGHAVSYQPTVSRARGARALRFSGTLSSRSGSSYSPCLGSQAICLSYFGGPVMQESTLTPIFWNPEGKFKYPAGYEAKIEQFFTDLKADSQSAKETNFYSVLPQYYDTQGGVKHIRYAVSLGAPIHDVHALPSGSSNTCTTPFEGTSRPCVQDKGVRAEISNLVKEGLPVGIGHEYIVFFPEGVDSCFDGGGNEDPNCSGTGYCGYHGTISLGAGEEFEYANEPDNGDPQYRYEFGGEEFESCAGRKGLEPADLTLSSTSHEISESITDPEVEEPELSWYDLHELNEFEYGEVGDICAYEYEQGQAGGGLLEGNLVPPANTSNQTINGHAYLLQDEWDNAHNTCSVSEDAANPKATFTDSATTAKLTGESISFDGTGSRGPVDESGVESYEWSWGDGTTSPPSSLPTAEHAYATSEGAVTKAFTVTLTVTDHNGHKASVSHAVNIEDRLPAASFTPPTGAIAGSAVQFDGSPSSDPDGTVADYKWSFGDGSSAAAARAAHTYAAGGEYTVTLTVTDNGGQTASVSHTVSVGAPPPPPKPLAIHVTGVKQNKKKGTIALSVSVPSAGVLSVREAPAAHSSLVSPVAGALTSADAGIASAKGKAKKAKGPYVKAVSANAGSASTVTLQIATNAAGKRLLTSKHKLTVKLLIAFAPAGGATITIKQAATMVLAAKHK